MAISHWQFGTLTSGPFEYFSKKNSENQSFLNERVTSLPYFYLVSGRGRYIGYVMGQFWTEYNVLKGAPKASKLRTSLFDTYIHNGLRLLYSLH